MKTFNTISFLLLITLSFVIRGQEKILCLADRKNEIQKENFTYFENRDGKIIVAEQLRWEDLKLSTSRIPNFGFIPHDVWFRFRIKNCSPEVSRYFLVLSNPNLDLVNGYVFRENGSKEAFSFSDLSPMAKDQVLRKPLFEFQINNDEEIILILHVNNGGEQFHFEPKFLTSSELTSQEINESYFLGIFMGLVILVILLNIYLFALTKEKLSLYYFLYLIPLLFLHGSLLGFGKFYIWPNSPYLANHANPFFASISVLFLLQFVRLYLDLKTYLPKIDKLLKYLSYLLIVTVVLSILPFGIPYRISILLINGLTLILNLSIIPIAFVVLKKGYKPAILFIIAFLVLVISLFGFILKNFGILPSGFFTDYGFQIGSAAEIILFSVSIIVRYKKAQDASIENLEEINLVKQRANEELEEKVIERTYEVNLQKQQLEDKNKEILSSITYAKRIQQAILPGESKINAILPECEILYLPKDIVSGDFYWIEETEIDGVNYVFFAAADCTGHGVPGAMMSVICSTTLSREVKKLEFANPALLLERVNLGLVNELSKNEHEIADGMDISLAMLDRRNAILKWSGANNPLLMVRGADLIEYEPVKRPIGSSSIETPFELRELELERGDRFFLYSDGIIDQFGGAKGKKLKKKPFYEWVLSSSTMNSTDQMNFLHENFLKWKDQEEQTDDVLVISFSYS